MNRKNLLIASVVLVVLAVGSFLFLNPKEPKLVCATDQLNTSGFYDGEQNCAVSVESYAEWNDYNSSAKPGTILAVVLGAAALGTAAVGLKKRAA